jgi:hypothetical protein
MNKENTKNIKNTKNKKKIYKFGNEEAINMILEKISNEKELTTDELSDLNFLLETKKLSNPLSEKGEKYLKKMDYNSWFYYKMKQFPNLEWIENSEDALTLYKSNYGYKLINLFLRGSKPINIPVSKKQIKKIISLIDQSLNKNQKNMTVFRGVRPNELFNVVPNSIYEEDGYSSTSTNFCVSVKFSPLCCILCFEIPKDITSYDFSGHNLTKFMADEKEILLEKGIVYHIGEPMVIKNSTYYPCVITKSGKPYIEKTIKNKLKKQNEYLQEFRSLQMVEKTPTQILEMMEKEFGVKMKENYFQFFPEYWSLCLDREKIDDVYELYLQKYKPSLKSVPSSSSCIIS